MSDRLRCPVLNCPRTMGEKFAMCKFHWDISPSHLRKKVVDSCRRADELRASGAWPTPEYKALVAEIVQAVEKEMLSARQRPPSTPVLRVPR